MPVQVHHRVLRPRHRVLRHHQGGARLVFGDARGWEGRLREVGPAGLRVQRGGQEKQKKQRGDRCGSAHGGRSGVGGIGHSVEMRTRVRGTETVGRGPYGNLARAGGAGHGLGVNARYHRASRDSGAAMPGRWRLPGMACHVGGCPTCAWPAWAQFPVPAGRVSPLAHSMEVAMSRSPSSSRSAIAAFVTLLLLPLLLAVAKPLAAQEPVGWGEDLVFHTFSIVGIDPVTGESGVAVTTRVACVGNAVPWVRPGVGAVATQGGTRLEYGHDLLDLLEQGVAPQEAMDRVVAADDGRERRQVGVIDMQGRSAQWTGSGQYGAEDRGDWVWERIGLNYAAQGNALVSTAVVDSVAVAFERTEGSGRHLADRLIEALYAGQVLGGDGRHGRTQSAAVLVADPRPGMSRRQDGVTTDINVCEHPEPIREVRRIYDTISETLGFRSLQQFAGRDVLQLKVMLHALGYYRAGSPSPSMETTDALLYDRETVEAVDAFRAAQAWQTSVPGWVDANTIARLWSRLEEAGVADEVRQRLRETVRVRR
ncbi:MAG: DUF1028 domain-containing protein [Gammaproteobacteria bacterium]|nr:DUF1028 domain-containing protein [Gammaproteobacteria bacterium]